MKLYTIQDLSKTYEMPEITLKKRAVSLGFEKIGKQWIFTEEQVKKILDPSLHKRGKRARKEDGKI